MFECEGRKVVALGEPLVSGGSRLPLRIEILREPAREEIGTQGTVKKATEVMHVELGRAVSALRRRLEWSQAELAHAIDKHGGKTSATDYMTISRWERAIDSPSPTKRMALAKIAAKRGHEDLAKRFRAPVVAWHLVATLRSEAN